MSYFVLGVLLWALVLGAFGCILYENGPDSGIHK